MKIPKRINVKTALIFLVISILITSGFFYVFAATPTTQMHLAGGPYPGAPDFTVWVEGSNYFAKDKNGQLRASGTNFSKVFQYTIDNGYYTYLMRGKYVLDTTIFVRDMCRIEGAKDQWVGNPDYPTVDEFKLHGAWIYYTGPELGIENSCALNISAIGRVTIQYLGFEGSNRTDPYTNAMCILIARDEDLVHATYFSHLQFNFWRLAIGWETPLSRLAFPYSDCAFDYLTIEYCDTGISVGCMCNSFRNVLMWRCNYGLSIMGITHGTEITHCWFNDIRFHPLRIWGNGTYAKFKDCWFERGNNSVLEIAVNKTYNPSAEIEVRELIFERCHFHHFNTSITYIMDFNNADGKVVNGSIQFFSCFFDKLNDTTITINPPPTTANIVIEDCYYQDTSANIQYYKGTEYSGNAEASNDDWITHYLAWTPTSIVATVAESDKIYIVQIKAMTSTQFQIKLFYESGGAFVVETDDKTINFYAEHSTGRD